MNIRKFIPGLIVGTTIAGCGDLSSDNQVFLNSGTEFMDINAHNSLIVAETLPEEGADLSATVFEVLDEARCKLLDASDISVDSVDAIPIDTVEETAVETFELGLVSVNEVLPVASLRREVLLPPAELTATIRVNNRESFYYALNADKIQDALQMELVTAAGAVDCDFVSRGSDTVGNNLFFDYNCGLVGGGNFKLQMVPSNLADLNYLTMNSFFVSPKLDGEAVAMPTTFEYGVENVRLEVAEDTSVVIGNPYMGDVSFGASLYSLSHEEGNLRVYNTHYDVASGLGSEGDDLYLDTLGYTVSLLDDVSLNMYSPDYQPVDSTLGFVEEYGTGLFPGSHNFSFFVNLNNLMIANHLDTASRVPINILASLNNVSLNALSVTLVTTDGLEYDLPYTTVGNSHNFELPEELWTQFIVVPTGFRLCVYPKLNYITIVSLEDSCPNFN